MGVLSWDKPQRAVSVEEWKGISADSAPPGVYTPNMSREDRLKWKAKLIRPKDTPPRVEIRKSFNMGGGAQVLIIVSLGGGYNYGPGYRVEQRWGGTTKGINVHVSANSAACMTFDQWGEMMAAVAEAKAVLESDMRGQ